MSDLNDGVSKIEELVKKELDEARKLLDESNRLTEDARDLFKQEKWDEGYEKLGKARGKISEAGKILNQIHGKEEAAKALQELIEKDGKAK